MNPFERALEVLDRRGWCQGTLQDKEGRVCMQGAVYEAIGLSLTEASPDVDIELVGEVFNMLIRHIPHRWAIAMFNDTDITTEEDVRLVLKKAAKEWDEGSESEGTGGMAGSTSDASQSLAF